MPDDLESLLEAADETDLIIIRRHPDTGIEVESDVDEDETLKILIAVCETLCPCPENLIDAICDEEDE